MYTVDRWQVNTTGNTLSVQQIAAPGDVVGTLAQIQRIAGNTSTNPIYFCTSLVQDMVIGAPGNTLTLSFNALCGANFSPTSNQITVNVFTGTGNTYKSGLRGPPFLQEERSLACTQAGTMKPKRGMDVIWWRCWSS